METGIRADFSTPHGKILAEVCYTHNEADFVAWWMYDWEETQNRRFHPRAHHFGGWLQAAIRHALLAAILMSVSAILWGEKSAAYIILCALILFCTVLGSWLLTWLLRGPKGLFRKLARWRHHRKMKRLAPQLAAQKYVFNLGRSHQLSLSPDSIIHRTELNEIEHGTMIIERIEFVTPWSAINRIEVCEHHVFIFDQRPFTTILPRRAFADERSFRQFLELVLSLHKAAIQSKATATFCKTQEERITR